MKNIFAYKIVVILALITYVSDTQAQSIDSIPSTKLVIGIDALSSAIYAGRNYGVNQSGFNPSLALNFKSGLSLSSYSYGMSATPGLITETDIQLSYTKKFLSVFSVTPGYAYIINRGDSTRVLNNVLNLSLGLDLNSFSINNFTGYSFGGGTTAWYDEFSLSYDISLLSSGKNSLSLAPVIVAILGTKGALATLGHGNSLYKTHVSAAVGKGKGKGNGKGNGGSTTTSTTIADISSKFIPLCYEFQLPLTYTHNQLTVSLVPHYDIPVNVDKPVESTLTGNPFYLVGKIAYTIRFHK